MARSDNETVYRFTKREKKMKFKVVYLMSNKTKYFEIFLLVV